VLPSLLFSMVKKALLISLAVTHSRVFLFSLVNFPLKDKSSIGSVITSPSSSHSEGAQPSLQVPPGSPEAVQVVQSCPAVPSSSETITALLAGALLKRIAPLPPPPPPPWLSTSLTFPPLPP